LAQQLAASRMRREQLAAKEREKDEQLARETWQREREPEGEREEGS